MGGREANLVSDGSFYTCLCAHTYFSFKVGSHIIEHLNRGLHILFPSRVGMCIIHPMAMTGKRTEEANKK
jgi:hypothetical protein